MGSEQPNFVRFTQTSPNWFSVTPLHGFGSAADWPAMVFRVEAVCMAALQQKDVDAGKIEQPKNLLADDEEPEHAESEPTDQRPGRLTESWRSTGIEHDPQKLF